METDYRLIKGRYYDSVYLMRVSKRVTGQDGVEDAAAVMATAKNLEALESANLLKAGAITAAPNDLLITVSAATLEQAQAVLDRVDEWLEADQPSLDAQMAPRTLGQALSQAPRSNLAVISVPGEYAAREARRALEQGLHVFLFSDNVSLEDEQSLKALSSERGLLVMGPDCGTAIIGGVGLGFANAVRRGSIGVVGASGTGMQEITTLIHRAGAGVSHAVGVGSRDLSDALLGSSTLQAIDALEADPQTKVIVVVSKPPGERAVKLLFERFERCSKPIVSCVLGRESDEPTSDATSQVAGDLEQAAHMAVALATGAASRPATHDLVAIGDAERARMAEAQRYVRGVFAGGTFCYQAQQVMGRHGQAVYSNEPLNPNNHLNDPMRSVAHSFIDLGADEFTVGRPHPMIDGSLRSEHIRTEAADPEIAVLLMDIILGHVSSPDPVGDVIDALLDAKQAASDRGGYLSVVASVCGTDLDPQDFGQQSERLRAAGVIVFDSSVAAATLAAIVAAQLDTAKDVR
jgi:FdrA protein